MEVPLLERLLSPVVEDQAIVVKARALNLLALVVALVIVVYSALAAPTLTPGTAIALAFAFVLCLVCYALGRRGRVRLASGLFFVGLFAAISFYMTDPGNTILDLTMAPFLYILVILPVGYVLRPRASFVAATLAALYIVGYLWIASPPAYAAYEQQASFWSNVGLAVALFYILSAVAWVFSQGVGQALQQARRQNRELLQVAEQLERQRRLQAGTGQQILELAERLAKYSSRQAAAIAQVSTSIAELEQAAREIARNAGSVDEAAQRTLQGAQEGQAIVWMNSEAIGLIHAKAQQGMDEATDLDERLKQVSRVATVISNIASQIQLVASNATLEAAEAGEAGRRFGVVAAEVKNLAADSLQQAKQVAQIVRQVQEAGEAVVAFSSEQVRAVQTGAAATSRSSAANQAIIQSATQMAESAGQIQQMTVQQQHAVEQVAASVQEIKAVVDRWVVSSYQMDEMVAGLRSLAEQLA